MRWKRPTDKREQEGGDADASGPSDAQSGEPKNADWNDASVEGAEQASAEGEGAMGPMQQRLVELEAERDQAVAGKLRALADFKNYQRRAVENEAKAATSGAASVVKALLPVLDHFEVALAQDRSTVTVEHLDQAMGMVHDELLKALEARGVERIEPQPGDAFDPVRHSALTQMQAEGIEPGCVASVFQSGYAIGDQVLRPAKVAVTPSE